MRGDIGGLMGPPGLDERRGRRATWTMKKILFESASVREPKLHREGWGEDDPGEGRRNRMKSTFSTHGGWEGEEYLATSNTNENPSDVSTAPIERNEKYEGGGISVDHGREGRRKPRGREAHNASTAK